jgi:hypothetical protein
VSERRTLDHVMRKGPGQRPEIFGSLALIADGRRCFAFTRARQGPKLDMATRVDDNSADETQSSFESQQEFLWARKDGSPDRTASQ